MADVTGPISTLPGSWHKVPEGMMCDEHSDRKATKRLQGETDSFGSEMNDMCDECVKEYEKGKESDFIGMCDKCETMDVKIKPIRDPDEGMCGPVYFLCRVCRDIIYKQAMEELREMEKDGCNIY